MGTDSLSAIAKTRIRRPPDEVFAAFADAERMSKFWFTRRDAGLEQGKTVKWFLGSDGSSYSFDVFVKEIVRPGRIVIEWLGLDGNPAVVTWTIDEADDGHSILTIEESGYSGSIEAIVERALDSTGGFNQVIIAAKAFIEYGIELNVVTDHA